MTSVLFKFVFLCTSTLLVMKAFFFFFFKPKKKTPKPAASEPAGSASGVKRKNEHDFEVAEFWGCPVLSQGEHS